MEGAVEGGAGDWDEVVTREPYRKVRLDHLLSKEHLARRYAGESIALNVGERSTQCSSLVDVD